ncbi:MAG: hypothetical protein O3A14_11535 [Cyanobacteria bacterium]|nr:hypothetical protein [Cyanobacteriota bacterium]
MERQSAQKKTLAVARGGVVCEERASSLDISIFVYSSAFRGDFTAIAL